MSADQLKALVIERLMYESDEVKLMDVLNLLSEQGPRVVLVTPEQQASIEEGLADYKAGRYVTQEELDKEDDGWL